MFPTLFSPHTKKDRKQGFLLALLEEMKINIEKCQVMEQRGFISGGFDVVAVEDARSFSGLTFNRVLQGYADSLLEFNRLYADCRAFEEMYSSSIGYKTKANAELLHAKKVTLDERFTVIYPQIVAAKKILVCLLEKV